MNIPPDIRTTFARILGGGVAAALLIGAGGWALERARLGADDQASLARVETELRQRFETGSEGLVSLASRMAIGHEQDILASASGDTAAAGRLFEMLSAALSNGADVLTGITVYDKEAVPLAWTGRVSDLPKPRLDGPAALFVAPDALGPRMVRIEPVIDRTRPSPSRLGTVVAEQVLAGVRRVPGAPDTFILRDTIVPVLLRARLGDAREPSPYAFVIPSSGGQVLVDAWVEPSELRAVRTTWRDGRLAAMASALALALILLTAPLIELRRRRLVRRDLVFAGLLGVVLGVRAILWVAATPLLAGSPLAEPFDLLVNSSMLAALVWLALSLIERRDAARLRRPMLGAGPTALIRVVSVFAAAGFVCAALLSAYEHFLRDLVSRTSLDLLHFSLHPLGAERVAMSFGLVLLHAGVIWSAALVIRLADLAWRRPRSTSLRASAVGAWAGGTVLAAVAARPWLGPVPAVPLAVALAAAGACAVFLTRPRGSLRRASQVARLSLFYLALVLPAVAMYASLQAFAVGAKEQWVATRFGPQALNQRDDLQRQLDRALGEIDMMRGLPTLVEYREDRDDRPERESPTTDQAFTVWSQTALGQGRFTSAVELFAASGQLVSRFALNLPEYGVASHTSAGCEWVVFEEVSQFAASERHVLRASKDVCDQGRLLGSVVVRVMLDYRTLPFLSAQRRTIESASLRPELLTELEGTTARDVEFTVYGWSRAPIYTLATGIWPLSDRTFQRLVESRQPFWESVTRDDQKTYRVYFLNDRGGIYALGYPTVTPLGHLVNLAELIFLTGVLCVALLAGGTLFNLLTSRTPASGRALLREMRSSFYRKLSLAFVVGAVAPVLVLAFLTRTYFANQFRAGVEQDAVKTATVAQRLVEDYARLEQRGTNTLDILDDQIMVLVDQAIDEAVNLFDPKNLQATSERDLFASGLLMPRTPGDVYYNLMIRRLPTYVGLEQVGDASEPYLVAAAPVRTAGREGIVTVPLTLRGQEIERQIDELDRQVLFASVLFVLLGAGLGHWMAERIADPVSRLTRATRRIARGDLDARIAATSSDELRRLVEDFNRMADDLKRQRSELERTQRLDAWADMARQVAHDIKNPLTPIQLSAEHAQRVNQDRGAPLSPVLDECMSAILAQVRLLRQISTEFSSFASSPTPRPETTEVPALIDEVVQSYRAGLTGRVEIDVRAEPDVPIGFIDRTLFARALTNVIENALYAMPSGGRLSIRTARRAGSPAGPGGIVVTVSDSGVGMDQEALGRIFEPYFSTKATGTGLGLTIANRNITLNGGTIGVESRRGEGTTVTIVLPVAAQKAP